jgi:two-component system, cell cycle sensor histidine kinase and response regulator CckA
MEAVGLLAEGISHEYNNLLSVIIGYTELALEKVTPSQSLHADLEVILKLQNVRRM